MNRKEAVSLLMNISAYDIDNKRGLQKQEAIEMAIEALKVVDDMESAYAHGYTEAEARFHEWKKTHEQKWISCSERLPDEKDAGILKKLGTEKWSEFVLATVEVKDERMAVIACTCDGEWYWDMESEFPDYKIIAWMPLPEAYREEQE